MPVRESRLLGDAAALAPFFPGLNLDDVDIQIGIPWYVALKGASGFTLGNTVYINDEDYSQSSIEGLSLIGHELQHVQQYRDAGGIVGMGLDYIGKYLENRWNDMNHEDAYRRIDYEKEAYATGSKIRGQLDAQYGGASCGGVCK